MTFRFSPARVFVGYLVGLLLVQAAWIITVPAFRGSDEFDHVYKAAAVARGQWTSPTQAAHGRGGIVTIPGDLVDAASRVCASYKYTGRDNCHPIAHVNDRGDVTVATGASAYNPTYYLVAGTIARPFHGAAADFVMRAVTALLSALMIAWAALLTARWARTWWPLLTLTLGLTPVLVYSTAIAAPNGITYASSVLLWAAVAALCHDRTRSRGVITPLCLGSVALVTTHTSGTMWLGLIALVCVILISPATLVRILRDRWRAWTLAAVVVVAATAFATAWILSLGTNSLGDEVLERGKFPFGQLPVYEMLWMLQAIGAFPLRNEPAPIPVYVIWGLPLLATIIGMLRRAHARERVATIVALGLLVAVPAVLTVVSYRTQSVAWQGRYSLPLWLGVTAIGGLVLDRSAKPANPRTASVVMLLAAVAMTMSTVLVGLREVEHGPSDPLAAGFPGGFVVVALLTFAGCLVPLLASWRPGHTVAPAAVRADTEPGEDAAQAESRR